MKAIGVALTSSLLFVSVVAGALDRGPRFEAGQEFPDIVLPSLEDGRPISIADFRGKRVLLHMFASW